MESAEIVHLLARITARDEHAFTQLYKAFSRKLYAYALHQLRDPTLAEEIVSDTLHEVWLHPERFRGESQFSTWLIGIARYKVLMRLRSDRAEPPRDDVDDLAEVLASHEAGPVEQIAHRQRQHHVRHCIDKLGADHRECVHLVFFEGLSLAEVAQLQACPEGTVKTRMFHARQKLRNCLGLMLKAEGASPPAHNATGDA